MKTSEINYLLDVGKQANCNAYDVFARFGRESDLCLPCLTTHAKKRILICKFL